MHLISRRMPSALKSRIWRVLDRLGPLPQRVKAGPARGLTLVAPLSLGRVYCSGKHEPHVLETLSQVVKPGMVVCDVGSHLGYYTLALARLVGVAGHVYAFEPLPRHVALLRRTLARNRLTQVTVVPQAVGAETGRAILEEWPNSAMTRIVHSGPAPWGVRCLEVPMTTLDDWAARTTTLERLDLIKLDVEGQELAALRGATALLSRYRPSLLCEIHRRDDVPYRPRELVAWLEGAGYAVAMIPPRQHLDETLDAALARLEAARPRPGWMAVLHTLATPRDT